MLLRLDRLMQAVRITAAGHDTARKVIDDQDLVILDDIVLILVHQVIGPEGKIHRVLDFKVFSVREVVDVEEFLRLLDALLSQGDDLVLFIDDKVTGFRDLLAHDGRHLGHLAGSFTALQLFGKDIAHFIDLGRFSALSGNDKRGPRLVDEDRVHLVDDAVMQFPLHKLLLINDHVIAEVVKAQLVIGNIGDIAVVLRPSLLGFHRLKDAAHGQPEEAVDFTHPVRITVGQIVIDCDDAHAPSLQRIQVCGKRTDEGLAFTGLHFGNTALVKDHTADQLDAEMLHAKHTPGCFTDNGICLRQNIVKSLAICQPFLKLRCFCSKLLIAQLHHRRAKGLDPVNNRAYALQLVITVRAEQFCDYAHV